MDTSPIKGIAVGPGLLLVEFSELQKRFPEEWTPNHILTLLKSLGVRPILGPSDSLWFLKESIEAAIVAATSPLHPCGDEPFDPSRHRVSRRFVEDHHDNLLACLLTYRSQNLVSNRTVDAAALQGALRHLEETIGRYRTPKGAGKPLELEMERGLVRRKAAESAPPPQSPQP